MIKVIQPNGDVYLMDYSDFELYSKYAWRVNPMGYLRRTKRLSRPRRQETCVFHREILGLAKGDGAVVDHINRNSLDNRKSNLRVATQQVNMLNRSTTKGIRPGRLKGGKWTARIQARHLGSFDTELQAAQAYESARLEAIELAINGNNSASVRPRYAGSKKPKGAR